MTKMNGEMLGCLPNTVHVEWIMHIKEWKGSADVSINQKTIAKLVIRCLLHMCMLYTPNHSIL